MLHGLLSSVTYKRLAGTAILRDFVGLPSQIMEHWALEPEMLHLYARHYQIGIPFPDHLIGIIQKSKNS
ncbi:MAG: M3 family metallopeptidase [Bacteroidetes bacterium]|nr:M3 family metallopeptidase [Bacteroidota bacterium]